MTFHSLPGLHETN
jgi:hypothetical protein